MSFNFPINPSLNQTYSVGDKTWIYDGRGWKLSTLQFSVTPIYDHANGAFDKANSANSLAQAAFDAANNAGSSEEIQTIFTHANGAFDKANSANVLAQAAFEQANTIVIFDQDLNTSNDVIFNRITTTTGEVYVNIGNTFLVTTTSDGSSERTLSFDTFGTLRTYYGIQGQEGLFLAGQDGEAYSSIYLPKDSLSNTQAVQIANYNETGNITLTANASNWTFNHNGNLIFPNSAEIRDVGGDLRLRAAPGEVTQLQGIDSSGFVDSAVKTFYNNGGYVTINTNIDANEHIWTFNPNGDLTVPNYIIFAGNTYIGDEPGAGTPVFRIVTPLNYGVTIETDSDISGNNYVWSFNSDSTLTFPDNTVQTTAYQTVVWDTANAAFNKANSANVLAQNAYDFANTRYSSSGGTISGDVQISGNLIVVGNTVTYSANDVIVNDPILLIANNNPANLLDIGFSGHYVESTVLKHTGLIRDVSTSTWYLFEGYEPDIQGANILNIADPTLVISNLKANLFGNANTATDADTLDGLHGTSYANSTFAQSSYTHANAAFNQANTDVTSISTTAGIYGNNTIVPVITLEANGRVRSITNTTISFPAETDTLQSVTGRGNTSNAIITLTNTTKTTSNTTGSLIVSGGIAVTGNVALQQIHFADGTSMNTAASGTGGASITWTRKTANYTAVNGDRIIADTSGGSFVITLPATPSLGDVIVIADGNSWATNTLNVARNGATIEGYSEDLQLDVPGIRVDLVYDGTTWEAYTFAAPQASVINDTTTNTTQYLNMVRNTSGALQNSYISTTKLYFNPLSGAVSATDFNSLSDATLKENISNITNAMDILESIRPVEFNWIDNNKKSYGVIAQEIEKVLPNLVETNKDNNIKSVSYTQLVPILIESIKELKKEIQILKKRKNNAKT